jgi:hypothetical protein
LCRDAIGKHECDKALIANSHHVFVPLEKLFAAARVAM